MTTATTCTCGCTEPHVIAKRVTDDGYTIKCWSDGMVTDRFGVCLRGLGKSRMAHAQESDRKAMTNDKKRDFARRKVALYWLKWCQATFRNAETLQDAFKLLHAQIDLLERQTSSQDEDRE